MVAYASDGSGSLDIHVLDLRTGNDRSVAQGTSDEDQPTWSDDGKTLAYVRSGSSADTIVELDAGTWGVKAELAQTVTISSLSFMPDGRQLVFIGEKAGGRDVYLLDKGSQAEVDRVTSDNETAVAALADGSIVTSAPNRGLQRRALGSSESKMVTSGDGDGDPHATSKRG